MHSFLVRVDDLYSLVAHSWVDSIYYKASAGSTSTTTQPRAAQYPLVGRFNLLQGLRWFKHLQLHNPELPIPTRGSS